MRYLLIAVLLAALAVEIRFIYWMNDTTPGETGEAVQTGPAEFPQTGDVEIGAQLSARAKRLEAERGDPVWPLNPKQGSRVVRGFIYRDGAPVRGAAVTIDQRPLGEGVRLDGYIGHPRWTDSTGDNGYFEVNTLPEGSFIVRAWDDTGMAIAQADLTANTHAHEASLTLTPAQPMNGVVVVENGEDGAEVPVRDALVFPLVAPEGAGRDAALLAYIPTRTGRDGTFNFPHVRGLVRFAVQATGHDPWVSPLVPAGSGDLHFKLVAGGTVIGATQEEGAGSPLPGVQVTLTPKNLPLAVLRVKSGKDGAFTFTGVPAGDYVLGVAQGDFTLKDSAPEMAVWPGKTFEAPPLQLRRTGALEGRVLDEQGRAAEGVEVQARQGVEIHEAVTDAGGRYRLRQLPPGEYAIAVALAVGTVTPESAPAIVQAGQSGAGPEFTLAARDSSGVVDCLVVDGHGTPIQGAAVHYRISAREPGGSPYLQGVLLTNGEGRASFEGVPGQGFYAVFASAPGLVSMPTGWESMAGRAAGPLTLAASLPATCRVQGMVVRGAGVPAPGREVHLAPAEGLAWPFDHTQLTNGEGVFDFTGLAPGAYRICAEDAPGACLDVTLADGTPLTAQQIVLP
jgi:hypothetical protein